MTSPAELLPRVVEAVRMAAAMLVAEAQRPGGPRGGGDKAGVDTEIERVLRSALAPLAAAGFTGEETGVTPPPAGSVLLWLVDPHDGTREFLRGWRGTAVSVALLRAGEPVLGVVCAPLSPDRGYDLIGWAENAPLTRNGVPIETHLGARALQATEYVYLNPRAARMAELNAELVAPARFIGMPSIAYRLARVAAGDGVATMSLHCLSSWDFAGGHALLSAAGGTVLDQAGRPVRYDSQSGASSIQRCFAGSPAAASELAGRDWNRIERAVSAPVRTHLHWPRPIDEGRLDRAYGCLLGHVASSACGGAGGDSLDRLPGCTELMLALARSIHRCGRYDAADAAQSYRRWQESLQTRPGQPEPDGLPESSVMHAAPIGLLCAGGPVRAAQLARQDSRLTHARAVYVEACAAYAAVIAVLIERGGSIDIAALLELAQSLIDRQSPGAVALLSALENAPGNPTAQDRSDPDTGPLIALKDAFYVLARAPDLESGMRACVTHGTRASAPVAAALWGARRGASSLPPAWNLSIQSCRAVRRERLPGQERHAGGERYVCTRPAEYWPDDLPLLADALISLT